ncbi:hypothetical protein NS14008_21665 [Nocardia seriolae]|nr:hypothetical protein NS14008_21665 [Nocardia seriolae]PSK29622.1 hypothetical protein C6575_19905 [Nocardia seriolae]RLP30520.1 hypothetical protein D6158_18310 [Nocardia seriolae]
MKIAWITAGGTVAAAVVGGLFLLLPKADDPRPTPDKPGVTTTTPAVSHQGMIVGTSPDGSGTAYVYASPGIKRIGELSAGYNVTILCVLEGPVVVNHGSSSSLWDKVPYQNGTGFVTDTLVITGTDQPVAPRCAS